MKRSELMEIWKLTKSFPTPNGPVVVVDGFELRVKDGEFVSIIGHSGCGKSTVLSMLAGLVPWTSGGIILAGKEVVGPGLDRAVVFQSPSLFEWMTAEENVRLGVDTAFPDRSRKERRELVAHHLERVGLAKDAHKRPVELSLGMRQRVGLARAFALNPKVLLLDEPFGMLDSITRMELQDVLIEICAEDTKTALMVTHDVDEALFLSDRVVMMTTGPHARVGGVLAVSAPRPRDRVEWVDGPEYQALRDQLIAFLEGQSAHAAAA